MIDCPECGAKNMVNLYADAVVTLNPTNFVEMDVNTLDNSWLECIECTATSDKYSVNQSGKLRDMWREL